MRYTRLRRAIESGTLIGTHGTPFQGGADKIVEAQKKRKRLMRNARLGQEDDLGPIQTRSGSLIDRKAKVEDDSTDGYDTDLSTEDDGTPLVKKRAAALKREVKAEKKPSESGIDTCSPEERKQASGSPASIGEVGPLSFKGSQNPPLKDERDWEKDPTNRPGAQAPTTQNTIAIVQQRRGNDLALEPPGIREPRPNIEVQSKRYPTVKSETGPSPLTALPPLHVTVGSQTLTGAATTLPTMSLKAEDDESKAETSSVQADIVRLPVAPDRKPSKYLLDAKQEMKVPLASMIPV